MKTAACASDISRISASPPMYSKILHQPQDERVAVERDAPAVRLLRPLRRVVEQQADAIPAIDRQRVRDPARSRIAGRRDLLRPHHVEEHERMQQQRRVRAEVIGQQDVEQLFGQPLQRLREVLRRQRFRAAQARLNASWNERRPWKSGRAALAIDTRSAASRPSASAVARRRAELQDRRAASARAGRPARRLRRRRTPSRTGAETPPARPRGQRVRKRLEEPLQLDEKSVDRASHGPLASGHVGGTLHDGGTDE